MKFTTAICYLAFFGLIGFAIHLTGRLVPLWALLLTPSLTITNKEDEDKLKEEES